MKTLRLNTLDNSTALLPQSGCFNVKLLKQGNGKGINKITVQWAPGNWRTVKIKGGVFILEDGSEVTEYGNYFMRDMQVRLDADYGFIYFPYASHGNLSLTYERNDGTDANRPIIDYNFHMPYMYDRNNMFAFNPTFNRPVFGLDMNKFIGNSDTSDVWAMIGLFKGLTKFNQSVSHLNPSDSLALSYWFEDCWVFNQPLDKWDMSKVFDTGAMFRRAYSFNQDISVWNMAKVRTMELMFFEASSFNQDISKWTFNKEVVLSDFISFSGIQPDNYGKLLKKLRNTDFSGRISPKVLGASNIKYPVSAQADRDWLINDGWAIQDGGVSLI